MKNTNMSIVGRSTTSAEKLVKKPGADKKLAIGKDKKGSSGIGGGKIGKKHLSLEEIHQQFEDAVGISKLITSSSFVALNLYSKSIFGEDVLANVSIECHKTQNNQGQIIPK